MSWAAMGYNSPLNEHDRPSVPYLEEFRHFFLSRHGADPSRKINCNSLRWLFIWRRDYVAHPRNKRGSVSRKIYNEDELLEAIKGVSECVLEGISPSEPSIRPIPVCMCKPL
jgi:glycoprotein 2-beta-D-xylosyltransferase